MPYCAAWSVHVAQMPGSVQSTAREPAERHEDGDRSEERPDVGACEETSPDAHPPQPLILPRRLGRREAGEIWSAVVIGARSGRLRAARSPDRVLARALLRELGDPRGVGLVDDPGPRGTGPFPTVFRFVT